MSSVGINLLPLDQFANALEQALLISPRIKKGVCYSIRYAFRVLLYKNLLSASQSSKMEEVNKIRGDNTPEPTPCTSGYDTFSEIIPNPIPNGPSNSNTEDRKSSITPSLRLQYSCVEVLLLCGCPATKQRRHKALPPPGNFHGLGPLPSRTPSIGRHMGSVVSTRGRCDLIIHRRLERRKRLLS